MGTSIRRGGPEPRDSPRLPPRPRVEPKRPSRERAGSPRVPATARVADLETRLGNAEEELRKLKEQISPPEKAAEESEASSVVEDAAGGKDRVAEEMLELETKLWKKEREVAECREENDALRRKLEEETRKGREMELRVEEEVKARAEAESESARLRVLMEQWRKAANAAADIVSGEEEAAAVVAEEGRRRRRSSSSVGKSVVLFGELWKRKGSQSEQLHQ